MANEKEKMNLEQQVISLEYAKKLKELGVEQESIFVWEYINEHCHGVKFYPYSIVPNPFLSGGAQIFSAFTASEILSILPSIIDTKRNEPFNNFRFNMHISTIVKSIDHPKLELARHYSVNYQSDTFSEDQICCMPHKLLRHNISDENLANCYAKVFIELIENGHVKI